MLVGTKTPWAGMAMQNTSRSPRCILDPSEVGLVCLINLHNISLLSLCFLATLVSSIGDSDPYCVVKWRGSELGRTRTCPNTREPDWEHERFQVSLPDETTEEAHFLVMEVWDEDSPGSQGDFLGQVTKPFKTASYLSVGSRCIRRSNRVGPRRGLTYQWFG